LAIPHINDASIAYERLPNNFVSWLWGKSGIYYDIPPPMAVLWQSFQPRPWKHGWEGVRVRVRVRVRELGIRE
jgi:hypothetical protein